MEGNYLFSASFPVEGVSCLSCFRCLLADERIGYSIETCAYAGMTQLLAW